MRSRVRLSLLVAALCAAVVAAAAVGAAPSDRGLLLPDLVQQPPSDITARVVDGQARLGFASAVTNAGAGPLVVEGRRAGRSREMSVAQLIRRPDRSALRRPGVGRLRYTRSPDHSHWHYLRFDRYVLRRPSGGAVVTDRKSGFCLGDRFDAALKQLPGEPATPPFRTRCGLRKPQLKRITEGISVGYGDNYDAYLEGQHLVLDGLEAGRYELVHHANADRALLEQRYDNNTACVAIDLSWPEGRPSIDETDC